MRKLLIFLICILIIVFGLFIINKLLNPKITYEFESTTTKSFKEYSLFNYGDNFETYIINNNSKFNITIDKVNITFNNSTLSINDYILDNVDKIYDYFSIYDKSVVVIGYSKDNLNYLLNYNYNLNEDKIISNYNGMIIDFESGLIFEDLGYIVNYSYINDNVYLKTGQDICDIKKTDIIVNKALEYYFDKNDKTFKKTEELYSSNLYSYINKYNLCN